ncbi:MAG: helix-turn-helix domain-containing protein [Saezia sp.]
MRKQDIENCIDASVERFIKDLGGENPHSLYNIFMNSAEKPLLAAVMRHTNQNQSIAAQWLGINRNTLRKKLIEHQLLE